MKIIHLKDSFEPKYVNRDEVKLAVLAKQHEHDVTINTSKLDMDLKPESFEHFRRQDTLFEVINKIKINRHYGFKIPFVTMGFYLSNIFNDCNLIHVHNTGSYSSFLAYVTKKLTGIPYVLKADLDESFYNKLKNSYAMRSIVLKPLHYADAITVFTNIERNTLIDLGIEANKIHIIPIGIRNSVKINPDSFHEVLTIGFMGKFKEQKGLVNIVEPLKKLMSEFNIKVIFAGDLEDVEYGNKILSQLKEYKNFKYLGFVKSTEEFYDKVDIVLIPSLWESGSIVTLEAMSHGKVVIASDIGIHKEYIKHFKNGFIALNNQDYYKYSKFLIEHKEIMEIICYNAKDYAKTHDWNNIYPKIEEIYSQIIK